MSGGDWCWGVVSSDLGSVSSVSLPQLGSANVSQRDGGSLGQVRGGLHTRLDRFVNQGNKRTAETPTQGCNSRLQTEAENIKE